MASIESRGEPTLLGIFKDLRADVADLFRQEVALAKSEMKAKAVAFARNAALAGVAALVGLYALFFVFFALNNLILGGLVAAGLTPALAAWLAPLALGSLLGLGAALLAVRALKSLKAMGRSAQPIPETALASLREDKEWILQKAKG